MNRSIYSKITCILSFMAIFLNLIIVLRTPPVSGYELSIYSAFPIIFWISMIFSLTLSITNIIFSASYDSKNWIFSLLSILCNYSLLIFLPCIRGYLFFATPGYDIFAHLSWIISILDSGNITGNAFYPITHILTASLCLFGYPLNLITINIINYFFIFIYMLFILILGKEISKTRTSGLFCLGFASPLMFSFLHHAFIPFLFALFMIPLYLFCIHKRNTTRRKVEFSILLVILSFLSIYFHPLTSVILLIILITFQLFYFFNHRTEKASTTEIRVETLILLINVVFFTWYLNFHRFLDSLNKLIINVFNPDQTTIINSQISTINSVNAGLLVLIEMFIKTYGSIFLYLFTATCCSIFILKKIYIKKVYGVNVLYSLLFLIATLFGIVLIFGVSIISEPIRAFSFAIVLSTILCGIVFSDIFENNESKKIKEIILIIMVVIICSTSIIGIFNLYESPLRGLPGSHMTLMNSNGLDWFLENDNNSIPLTINTKSIYKYELYYLQFNNERFEKTLLTTKKIPTHFGYETNKTLSNSLDLNETYIITSENIEQFPLAVLKSERYKYPEYLNSDFDLLNNDKSVSKYYMNGEFEIWKI